jgi:branched-chain amino acid transport system ATP-binding protein
VPVRHPRSVCSRTRSRANLYSGPVALLAVEQVVVRFGGVVALDEVDLEVDEGAITGLIGPNGAGKTTLFNVICGLQGTEAGHVRLGDDLLDGRSPHRRARAGISRTFQRLEVFGSMTVRDNVRVAAEVRRSWSKEERRGGLAPLDIADSLLDRVGLAGVADARVDALPTGLARLVEVARGLATAPRVLLLDEPSSGLSEAETDEFGELLTGLIADGLGILLVEHDVELVMRVCERIHVLDFGRIISVGSPVEVQRDRNVQSAYLGTAPA